MQVAESMNRNLPAETSGRVTVSYRSLKQKRSFQIIFPTGKPSRGVSEFPNCVLVEGLSDYRAIRDVVHCPILINGGHMDGQQLLPGPRVAEIECVPRS